MAVRSRPASTPPKPPAPPPPVDPAAFARLRDDNRTTVLLGGRRLKLRHHNTRMWLAHLADQALMRIFPGFLPEDDQAWLYTQLADPTTTFDVPQLRAMSHAVVADVTGLPWYVAARLANLAGRGWFLLDPITLTKGVDLLDLPARRALSVVYLLQRQGCSDEDEKITLDRELWAVPAGEQPPSWTPEQQSSSFAAFRAMASRYGGTGARNLTALPPGTGGV